MKVFAVIDVPDGTDLDMCYADCEVYQVVNALGDTETVARKKNMKIKKDPAETSSEK